MKKMMLLLLLGFQTASAQVNLNLGLKAYYPFSGNANDASGNNLNPAFNNATLTADRFGVPNSAYHFNGIDNYMRIPNDPNLNLANQISLVAWVKPLGFYSGPCHGNSILIKGDDANLSTGYYALRYDDGQYLNFTQCGIPTPDIIHENYWGYQAIISGGYSPYVIPNQWICVIYTYDGSNAKLYLNCQLVINKVAPGLSFTNSYDLFFGKMNNPSFPYWLNADLDDIRIYDRALNISEVNALAATCLVSCPQKNDFSFTIPSCSPYTLTFSTNATGYNNIRWDFGDGNTNTGLSTVSHTYSTGGNYLVTLITDYSTCSDTVKKTVTVNIQNDNSLISTNDTTICKGSSKQIISNPGLNFCWNPTLYLSNPAIANPMASPPVTTTYYLTSLSTGTNLITNGNFSSGNTSFTSQYFYTSNNTTEGEYYVGTNPQAWYFAHYACTDHTTGNGNMMMVNGSPSANVEVWKTTVAVTPNTNYAFSTWICSISVPNPAQLAFSINGNSIGSLITASLPPCNWVQFYTTWNSGNATSATISIINKNTILFGNDFALDDISFSGISVKRDSVKITVDNPSVITNNSTTICEGATVQLNTTGASTYSWSPATGLNNPNIPNPIATPVVTTQYIVTGTTANGCMAKDTVVITVNATPLITKSADTTICQNGSAQLLAGGGAGYSWSPAGSLNNPSIANPVATPSATTTYYVTVTGANSCSKTDSIKVSVRSASAFAVNPSVNICLNKSVQLNASGGDLYNWTPAGTLSNATISNPVASPATTTTYSVSITDTLCNNTSVLSTVVTVLPLPIVRASKSNDLDCSFYQSQLSASGAAMYSWSPAGTLNNASAANPVATPVVTTQYVVTGTDLSGCVNSDSITVNVTAANLGSYLMPSAFTPNRDGLNDCYGIKYWGIVQELDFSIYNRWGERVFYTKQPGQCWDGRYKNIPQDPAVFVYMIKAKTNCGDVFRKGTFTLIR